MSIIVAEDLIHIRLSPGDLRHIIGGAYYWNNTVTPKGVQPGPILGQKVTPLTGSHPSSPEIESSHSPLQSMG
jgi:hypothetical protein